jgi:hypothetical protein
LKDRLNFPKTLLDAWKSKYGPEDYGRTITEIIDAVNTVGSSNSLSQSAILRKVCDRISNKEFADSDLGKFVLIAILAGREVDSGKFFHGSNALPRANSYVLIKEVLPKIDQNGNLSISLTVVYEGIQLNVTKLIDDVFSLLY